MQTIKGKVHFKDVKFEYPSRPSICVLRGLNLIVEPGKTLAIVGESGCGKSTILSLLERFYNPSKGVIVRVYIAYYNLYVLCYSTYTITIYSSISLV